MLPVRCSYMVTTSLRRPISDGREVNRLLETDSEVNVIENNSVGSDVRRLSSNTLKKERKEEKVTKGKQGKNLGLHDSGCQRELDWKGNQIIVCQITKKGRVHERLRLVTGWGDTYRLMMGALTISVGNETRSFEVSILRKGQY